MTTRAQSCRGFSLLEVTIVVAIMGLLAAVAIPQFATRRGEPRTALANNLSLLRAAIDSYRSQHDAFPGPTAARFADGLLKKTDASGNAAATEACGLGPYLRMGALPVDPYTNSRTVRMVDRMPAAPVGPQGWIFCTTTGEIRCNATGTLPDGKALFGL